MTSRIGFQFVGAIAALAAFVGASKSAAAQEACGSGNSCQTIDGAVIDFAPQPLAPTSNVYVLGSDRKLWLEFGTGSNRTNVATSVQSFQPIDSDTLYFLQTNGVLFNKTVSTGANLQVDTTVASFSALDSSNIYVKGTDNKLWLEHGTMSNRSQIDANVTSFQGINQGNVYVRGSDARLWDETPNGSNRINVDNSVTSFQVLDNQLDTIYVLGSDGRLWNEFRTQGQRFNVDAAVIAFSAADARVVFVLGSDHKLWRENRTAGSRSLVMTNINAVKAVSRDVAYALGGDGLLFRVTMPDLPTGLTITQLSTSPGGFAGPAICVSGSGFTPGGAAFISYSGVPGQNDQGHFTVGVASNGTFNFSDSSQEGKAIFCSNSEAGGEVTVTVTDGTPTAGGTGNSVSTTLPASNWCTNFSFDSIGTCIP